MVQANYVEGCSMQRPPLLEANGFCFWKARFETYVKSKDIDLWKVIQNGDFYYEVEDSETKLMKETPYELLEDDQKKKVRKNNKAKMTLYNALPRKEYEIVFMCKTAKEVWHTPIITHQGNSQVNNCKIDLLTQEYKKFSISNEETINCGFTRFNAIVTSLKSLDPDYSSKNHVRKFLRALPLKWRAKVTAIEEAKELATLPLDELIVLKAKFTREQTSDYNDSHDGSDEDIDEEEETEAFNLLARNFRKLFHKGNRFGRGNRVGNEANRFGKGREGHFASECGKPKENKAFVRGAWSDSEDGNEAQNDATYSQTSKAYIVLNKETMRIEESLNFTFDESLPEPKSSSLVEDDRIDEPIAQDLNGLSLLQYNISNEGYPKSLKDARDHPIERVIGELNEMTLRSKTKQA
ncbi:hypothetical protein Tco_0793027 [Tanacetum coccineum]